MLMSYFQMSILNLLTLTVTSDFWDGLMKNYVTCLSDFPLPVMLRNVKEANLVHMTHAFAMFGSQMGS